MTSVQLRAGDGGPLFLGEVELGEDPPPAVPIVGTNETSILLRNVIVDVEGDGAQYVTLFDADHNEQSAPMLVADSLSPDDEFTFYAQAVVPEADAPDVGTSSFEFVVKSTSVKVAGKK